MDKYDQILNKTYLALNFREDELSSMRELFYVAILDDFLQEVGKEKLISHFNSIPDFNIMSDIEKFNVIEKLMNDTESEDKFKKVFFKLLEEYLFAKKDELGSQKYNELSEFIFQEKLK